MQNLSDEERKDIDELVSSLKPDEVEEKQAETDIPINGSNGRSDSDSVETDRKEEDISEIEEDSDITTSDILKVVSLQNDRLGILNKKVDVLTRLVELILRANLEDVE